jgi:hypothetical protein
MTDKQSEAYVVPLYERLEKIPADIRFGVKDGDDWRAGTVWYPIGAMCQQAASELRRLDALNAELVEALNNIIEEPKNTMSDNKALREIVRIAKAALTKAEGK